MDERYIGLVKETIRELSDIMNVSIKDQFKDAIKSAMGRSVRTKDPMFWPAGMLILGLVEARGKIADKLYGLEDISKKVDLGGLVCDIDKAVSDHLALWNDKYGSRIDYIDDALSGAALIKLYCQLEAEGKAEGDLASSCKQAANRIYGYLTAAPRDKTGSIVYNASRSSNVFADGAGQTSMFLVLYGNTFGDGSAVELGELQLLNFLKYGCDEKSDLPYHGYSITESSDMAALVEKKGVLSWGRAAGWVIMGLSECRGVPELRDWYDRLVKSLLTYQKKDGGFAWQIQATEGHLDTSATGMIVYGLGGASESSADISDTIEALWQNIQDNKVQGSLSSCDDFGVHYQNYGHYPWGQGAVLAALSK
jgi:rhamnogalacturonyl hydrolase YesR